MKRIPTVAVVVGLCALGSASTALASQELATKSGCMACHATDRKLVGPSFKDIAAKYKGRADAVAYLSDRVRKGGPGNWGQIPMQATDAKKLSDADLKTVLNWILSAPK